MDLEYIQFIQDEHAQQPVIKFNCFFFNQPSKLALQLLHEHRSLSSSSHSLHSDLASIFKLQQPLKVPADNEKVLQELYSCIHCIPCESSWHRLHQSHPLWHHFLLSCLSPLTLRRLLIQSEMRGWVDMKILDEQTEMQDAPSTISAFCSSLQPQLLLLPLPCSLVARTCKSAFLLAVEPCMELYRQLSTGGTSSKSPSPLTHLLSTFSHHPNFLHPYSPLSPFVCCSDLNKAYGTCAVAKQSVEAQNAFSLSLLALELSTLCYHLSLKSGKVKAGTYAYVKLLLEDNMGEELFQKSVSIDTCTLFLSLHLSSLHTAHASSPLPFTRIRPPTLLSSAALLSVLGCVHRWIETEGQREEERTDEATVTAPSSTSSLTSPSSSSSLSSLLPLILHLLFALSPYRAAEGIIVGATGCTLPCLLGRRGYSHSEERKQPQPQQRTPSPSPDSLSPLPPLDAHSHISAYLLAFKLQVEHNNSNKNRKKRKMGDDVMELRDYVQQAHAQQMQIIASIASWRIIKMAVEREERGMREEEEEQEKPQDSLTPSPPSSSSSSEDATASSTNSSLAPLLACVLEACKGNELVQAHDSHLSVLSLPALVSPLLSSTSSSTSPYTSSAESAYMRTLGLCTLCAMLCERLWQDVKNFNTPSAGPTCETILSHAVQAVVCTRSLAIRAYRHYYGDKEQMQAANDHKSSIQSACKHLLKHVQHSLESLHVRPLSPPLPPTVLHALRIATYAGFSVGRQMHNTKDRWLTASYERLSNKISVVTFDQRVLVCLAIWSEYGRRLDAKSNAMIKTSTNEYAKRIGSWTQHLQSSENRRTLHELQSAKQHASMVANETARIAKYARVKGLTGIQQKELTQQTLSRLLGSHVPAASDEKGDEQSDWMQTQSSGDRAVEGVDGLEEKAVADDRDENEQKERCRCDRVCCHLYQHYNSILPILRSLITTIAEVIEDQTFTAIRQQIEHSSTPLVLKQSAPLLLQLQHPLCAALDLIHTIIEHAGYEGLHANIANRKLSNPQLKEHHEKLSSSPSFPSPSSFSSPIPLLHSLHSPLSILVRLSATGLFPMLKNNMAALSVLLAELHWRVQQQETQSSQPSTNSPSSSSPLPVHTCTLSSPDAQPLSSGQIQELYAILPSIDATATLRSYGSRFAHTSTQSPSPSRTPKRRKPSKLPASKNKYIHAILREDGEQETFNDLEAFVEDDEEYMQDHTHMPDTQQQQPTTHLQLAWARVEQEAPMQMVTE